MPEETLDCLVEGPVVHPSLGYTYGYSEEQLRGNHYGYDNYRKNFSAACRA